MKPKKTPSLFHTKSTRDTKNTKIGLDTPPAAMRLYFYCISLWQLGVYMRCE